MAVLEFSRTRNITPVAGAVRSKVGAKPEYRAAIPSVWTQDYNHYVLFVMTMIVMVINANQNNLNIDYGKAIKSLTSRISQQMIVQL